MSINERAAYLLNEIWEHNDLNAVDLFRKIIMNEDLILYREKEENLNCKPLFHRGEPIVHGYSLRPLEYKIDIDSLKSAIGKNDAIGFTVDNQHVECGDDYLVNIHILSGLISKINGNQIILFPQIISADNQCDISRGDIVKYITAADYRHHYGEVRAVEQNKVWIKEYAGYSFDHDGCKLFQQDSFADKIVCIPYDACAVLSQNDFHIEDMRHASTIRNLWRSPCPEACDEFKSWFSAKRDETIVYYIECENKKTLTETPYLYTIKELAEREAAKRTLETIRKIELPKSCVKGNAFLFPNTDEAAREMGAKVTYIKQNWSVVEISIGDLISRFPDDKFKFQIDGIFDFSGDPVVECSVTYSPDTEMVSSCYRDMDIEIDKYYPHVLDAGNCTIPQVDSIVQYFDCLSRKYVIAKVTAIDGKMARVAKWDGIIYSKELICSHGQDDWTSCSYVFVPIASCEPIPDINLSSEQFYRILRFEDNNEFIKSPWRRFYLADKVSFDINDLLLGLENLRSTMPQLFIGWIRFITADFIMNIDSPVLKMAEKYISWICSVDNYGDGTSFEEKLDEHGVDYYELIEEMSFAIEKIYFPESGDY